MRIEPQPNVAACGIDIGRRVCHVVALDVDGHPVQKAKFSHEILLQFFAAADRALLGMEACAGSQRPARSWPRSAIMPASSRQCS